MICLCEILLSNVVFLNIFLIHVVFVLLLYQLPNLFAFPVILYLSCSSYSGYSKTRSFIINKTSIICQLTLESGEYGHYSSERKKVSGSFLLFYFLTSCFLFFMYVFWLLSIFILWLKDIVFWSGNKRAWYSRNAQFSLVYFQKSSK